MDLSRLKGKYKQFGGLRLVKEYTRMGVLPTVVKEAVKCVIHRTSFKAIYPAVEQKVNPVLCKKYRPMLDKYDWTRLSETSPSNKVWFSWWQGMEQAPNMVNLCLQSLRQTMPDREIVIVTKENYRQWVTFPQHIEEKAAKGYLPLALLTDLLRLELLIRYGGVWIDSTVLCTGWKEGSLLEHSIQKQLSAPLFMYRYESKMGRFQGFSNWFIVAGEGNTVLVALRDMLYAYWRDYDCVLNYYIFHRLLHMIVNVFPDVVKKMPVGLSITAIWLGNHLNDPYDEEKWNRLTNTCCFHKMNYRTEIKKDGKNFYAILSSKILNKQGE